MDDLPHQTRAAQVGHHRLVVHPDKSATLTMRPDSGKPAVVTQQIPWTDFDQDECELYVILTPGQRPLLLQPCEY